MSEFEICFCLLFLYMSESKIYYMSKYEISYMSESEICFFLSYEDPGNLITGLSGWWALRTPRNCLGPEDRNLPSLG